MDVVKSNFGINLFSIEVFVGLTLLAAILMVSTIPFKTPDKVFGFVPKKLTIPFIVLILVTLKYSMFIVTCYYILVNLTKFFTERAKEDVE